MKSFAKNFLLGVIIPLLALEVCSRIWLRETPPYIKVAQERSAASQSLFFLGKSWMAAAIDSDLLKSNLENLTGRKTSVFNMSISGANPAYHLLGLNQLIRQNPNALKGTLVFIETARGLPPLETESGSWVSVSPRLIGEMLSTDEWPKFWESNTPSNEKAFVTLASVSSLCGAIPSLQGKVNLLVENWVNDRFLDIRAFLFPGRPILKDDGIRSVAGVRVDDPGIRHHRVFIQNVQKEAQLRIRTQQPFEDWERLVVRQIVEFIIKQGGRPYFLDLPVSSYLANEALSPVGQADVRKFREVTGKWGTPLIIPKIKTDDSDFPDYSHLKETRVAEYTGLVAREIQKIW